jgi:hypothetical protein
MIVHQAENPKKKIIVVEDIQEEKMKEMKIEGDAYDDEELGEFKEIFKL